MRKRGDLSFRVTCRDCGGRCAVYSTDGATRYFKCRDCERKFKIVVEEKIGGRRPEVGGRNAGGVGHGAHGVGSAILNHR